MIVDAYLEYLRYGPVPPSPHIDLQSAVCTLLYTLCKVRDYKVIVGFLSNEPKYLEPILARLEETIQSDQEDQVAWQVPYVLLLWLSHLLLAPFDLSSISARETPADPDSFLGLYQIPQLAKRVLRVGLAYLGSPTKAQDAAASMLVRLSIRPDVVKSQLADALLEASLPKLATDSLSITDTYELLGALRLVAGIAAAAELSHLVPLIYSSCERAFVDDSNTTLTSNAVAKKFAIKTLRNIAILSLRSAGTNGILLDFLQTTSVLENVVDYLLRALGDKDTQVRYAAAKAISLLVQELDREMGHEIIQAVLDSFKEDMPRSSTTVDFTIANPLKWHGLTLALAHTLFKRSGSPEQLPDILDALISALQFQQRTSTGSTLGTNIRDAANFGIWSLARRYTTAELLSVSANSLHSSNQTASDDSVIQVLATQLLLSACLDPAGNIRRGSSAALQEVVGRHPNKIIEGITLVQVVDYHTVSLRSRAMTDVAHAAAGLHPHYWRALFDGLLGWRGLGSADVPSRESTANSIARLAISTPETSSSQVLMEVLKHVTTCPQQDVERLHGLALSAANIVNAQRSKTSAEEQLDALPHLVAAFGCLVAAAQDFSPRTLRSEYPAALSRYITALCDKIRMNLMHGEHASLVPLDTIDRAVDRLLARHEESILVTTPDLARSLLGVKRAAQIPLGCIAAADLANAVSKDGMKSTLHSAGRALALGALASLYSADGLAGDKATTVVTSLCGLLQAMNVNWRIIGARSLELVVQSVADDSSIDAALAAQICAAIDRGLNDYTIDERGDIGSLVRLQCIACASQIFSTRAFLCNPDSVKTLEANIYRISLEKLDRVRLQAAKCRSQHLDLEITAPDIASVSSHTYFEVALQPLWHDTSAHIFKAVVQGCISCAGLGAKSILQAARYVLINGLYAAQTATLETFLTTLITIMKEQLAETTNSLPALELLAFLLDMQLPQQRLTATPSSDSTTFKWRNLLSVVQKSHHKSNEIPKILAAVHVYLGLADVPAIRSETLKKLLSMLQTNPYPHVRIAVAEALYMITREEGLEPVNWSRPAKENGPMAEELREKYVVEELR